jgi:phage gp29-like protein
LTYDTQEAADQQKLVDVLTKAVNMGMEVDVDQAHTMLQIPRAKEGAKILTIGGQVNQKAALRAALTTEGIQFESIADNMARQLTELSVQYESAVIENIAAMVAEAGDFESALAQMTDLSLQQTNPEFATLIAKGLTAAKLAGITEAK